MTNRSDTKLQEPDKLRPTRKGLIRFLRQFDAEEKINVNDHET